MFFRVGAMFKRADPGGGTTEAEAQHGGTLGKRWGKRWGKEAWGGGMEEKQ